MTISSIFNAQKSNHGVLRARSSQQRIRQLQALRAKLIHRKRDICDAQNKELKTCDMDTEAQLMMLNIEIDFICKHLSRWMKPRRVKNSQATMGKKCYIQYEPKGSVLNISTWNAPIAINIMPIIGALAAGNSAIIKPSELAPHTATVTSEIISAIFPRNQCAVFEGGPEIAQELLNHPFNHIYYTGGHRVGRIVMKAAAENFSDITLEMGGKNPAIIDATAEVSNAALKLAWGRMANAGQVCIGPDYILVDQMVEQSFISAAKAALIRLYNPRGYGFKNCAEFPRLISDSHFERVKGLIDDAISKGAILEFGGEYDAEQRYISPTILSGVSDTMAIMQEEVFGPVMVVIGCENSEQMLSAIKRQHKPLALYIFSKNRSTINYFLHNTSAGSTVVNHNLIQSGTNPNLAFGGVNHSGTGRIGGFQSFLEFSNPRSIVESPLGWRDININFPPYSKIYKKLVAKMLS
ncbi:aldehyde dehydrogenase family protein [Microbulbifer spongiae]|uniref:Aldehyde dehydrogenase n=1 Tax=Microbulbifer spongiae TaxID=2944933 RepID=A0ABY9E7N1_9GAMM|nr:aldehyde dehydrogenase family protein [Microbulbifer sp. MI-G]WKD49044.1 aldehyde dehydrogenase family protein [Microbulbifer sp. MI-G]